jgi:histidine triad (HIT) family protein
MAEGPCLFCRIAKRELPAEIVGESEGLLAFRDVQPQAPTHLLIIPVEHIAGLNEATEAHAALLGRAVRLVTRLAMQFRLTEGYRLVVNSGPAAGQSVSHLHFHLLGGRTLRWPPG